MVLRDGCTVTARGLQKWKDLKGTHLKGPFLAHDDNWLIKPVKILSSSALGSM